MKEPQRIPDSELEIMMAIWEAGQPVNSDFIMNKLNKNWAKPTLLNLLNRLHSRGFVDFYKEGKFKMYSALIKQGDYLKLESRSFLKKLHRNSLTSLVASLYDGKSITDEDLKELERFIREVK